MPLHLNPCPFCGSPAVALRLERDVGMAGSDAECAFVRCSRCGAMGPRFDDWGEQPQHKAKAKQAWNGRVGAQ